MGHFCGLDNVHACVQTRWWSGFVVVLIHHGPRVFVLMFCDLVYVQQEDTDWAGSAQPVSGYHGLLSSLLNFRVLKLTEGFICDTPLTSNEYSFCRVNYSVSLPAAPTSRPYHSLPTWMKGDEGSYAVDSAFSFWPRWKELAKDKT